MYLVFLWIEIIVDVSLDIRGLTCPLRSLFIRTKPIFLVETTKDRWFLRLNHTGIRYKSKRDSKKEDTLPLINTCGVS